MLFVQLPWPLKLNHSLEMSLTGNGLHGMMDFDLFGTSGCEATMRLGKATNGLCFSSLLESAGGILAVAPDLKGVLLFVWL